MSSHIRRSSCSGPRAHHRIPCTLLRCSAAALLAARTGIVGLQVCTAVIAPCIACGIIGSSADCPVCYIGYTSVVTIPRGLSKLWQYWVFILYLSKPRKLDEAKIIQARLHPVCRESSVHVHGSVNAAMLMLTWLNGVPIATSTGPK